MPSHVDSKTNVDPETTSQNKATFFTYGNVHRIATFVFYAKALSQSQLFVNGNTNYYKKKESFYSKEYKEPNKFHHLLNILPAIKLL